MIGSVLYIEALPWPNWEKKKKKSKRKFLLKLKAAFSEFLFVKDNLESQFPLK